MTPAEIRDLPHAEHFTIDAGTVAAALTSLTSWLTERTPPGAHEPVIVALGVQYGDDSPGQSGYVALAVIAETDPSWPIVHPRDRAAERTKAEQVTP